MLDIPTHMDFVGQAKAERWSRLIITCFGVIGFIWGAISQQYSQTVLLLGVGFLISSLITIPPWPIYRHNTLQWQTNGKKKKPVGSANEEVDETSNEEAEDEEVESTNDEGEEVEINEQKPRKSKS